MDKLKNIIKNKKIQQISSVIILVVGVFLVMNNYVGANPDYICTKTTLVNDTCSDGSWGGWDLVSTENEEIDGKNYLVSDYDRVYTGTKILKMITQYYSIRTTCSAGYTQISGDGSGGISGFQDGTVITEGEVCQIKEAKKSYELVLEDEVACSFSIEPNLINKGDSSILTWSTANAASLVIDQGIGEVDISGGSQNISPTVSTAYTGTVLGEDGETSSCSAVITVGDIILDDECIYSEENCGLWELVSQTVLFKEFNRICSGKTELTGENCEVEQFKEEKIIDDKIIPMDLDGFECSLDQIEWKDCSETFTFIGKIKPIYLRVVDKLGEIVSVEWFIENNDEGFLGNNKSRGVFDNHKVKNPTLNLEFGTGVFFEKEVLLIAEGAPVDLSGIIIREVGNISKTLKIKLINVPAYMEI